MGYTNSILISRRIAQSLTSSGPSNIGVITNLLDIGNVLDPNLIPDSTIAQYINWADQYINAALNLLYLTPFNQMADFEDCLFAGLDHNNRYITFEQPVGLNVGDKIQILYQGVIQTHHIATIVDAQNMNIFQTVNPIVYDFPSGSRVTRIKYPQPVIFISTSLAASWIYDRYFMAQADPNKSDYGTRIRQQAESMLNNILQGRTILYGVRRTGRSSFNPNLVDRYSLPGGNMGSNSLDKNQ